MKRRPLLLLAEGAGSLSADAYGRPEVGEAATFGG